MPASLIVFSFIPLWLAFYLAFKKPRTALYVVIFLAPWEGLDADLGLRLTAYLIFLAPLVVATLLRFSIKKVKRPILPGASALTLFMTFGIVWSLAQLFFLPAPDVQIMGGALRGPQVRAITQILMFLLTISPVFLVPFILHRPEELKSAGKVYLWSVFTLATLGWIQLLVWYGTGTNPMPIGLVNSLLGGMGDTREGAYVFMDLAIYRMSSFAGEPKNLGGSLVIALLIIQVILSTTKIPSAKKLICLWVFLAVSTIATLSTTAFFLWPLGTATHLVAQRLFRSKYATTKVTGLRMIGMLSITIVLLGLGVEMVGIPVRDMLLDRTVNRVEESQFGVFEDFDDAIKNYLLDHPAYAITGVGLGNIHLYADSYLAPAVAVYTGGGVFVAKAQYLRFISEVGIIGFGLFLFWYWQLIYLTNRRLRTAIGSVNLKVLIPVGAASLLVFLAAGSGAPQFYLMAGVIAAAHAVMCRGVIK